MLYSMTYNQQRKQNLRHNKDLFDSCIARAKATRNKEELPLIFTETCMEPGTWVCALDFDEKDPAKREDYGVVAWACEQAGLHHARTPSGNLKIFLKLATCLLPRNAETAAALRTAIIESPVMEPVKLLLMAEQWDWLIATIDTHVNTMTRVFATEQIRLVVLEAEAGPVVSLEGSLDEAGNPIGSTIVSILNSISSHRYNPYTHDLPKGPISEFIGIGAEAAKREAFIRILLNLRKLQEGFDLPQKKFANELNVSISIINKWIKELQQRGWLRCIDHSYCPGVKAKTFKATGELLYALQRVAPKTHKKPLPVQVESGNFYRQMLTSLWYFNSETEFLAWVKRLKGITDRRLKEAGRYARAHYRRAAAARADTGKSVSI